MKKILSSILIITFFVLLLNLPSFSDNTLSWYIRKRGNNKPQFPAEAPLVEQYNAYYIGKDEKVIYLTFDAGYENGNISQILDILKAENVPAAFFILDNIIYKNPKLVKRMADEGHLVCNHTKKHKNLCNSSCDEINEDLSGLEKLCLERCNVVMSKYFRFPEGRYSIESLKSVNELGYKTIFWSFGYDDWDNNRQLNPQKAIKNILDNTHNGEVILLHPTSSTNREILPTLIKEWRKMGYDFGTLDQLTN